MIVSSMLVGLITRPWVRRLIGVALAALAIVLFLFNLRRAGETSARVAAQLARWESRYALQREMLKATTRRPIDHSSLADRLGRQRF